MDARVDGLAAAPDLVETSRFDLPVLALATHDGIEPDLEVHLAVELPDLVAFFALDHARRSILQLLWQPSFEHVWRFHEVVVNREERVANGPRLGIVEQAMRLALAPVQANGVGRHAR